jgi:GntR family transcriptional regulator, transcriptional repressor for pyruvate dehydrogenase complex
MLVQSPAVVKRRNPEPSAPAAAASLPSRVHAVVSALAGRIHQGQWPAGHKLPTEAALMAEHAVSRTVVREALSRLQAEGLIATRHGIGSFVQARARGSAARGFQVGPRQLDTLHDVIAVLELRIGIETEAAGLAAQRRSAEQLARMRQALAAFAQAVEAGRDAVEPDFAFHQEIARATQNSHFAGLLATLGPRIIPRARLDAAAGAAPDPERQAYLRRVHGEHESILDAIAAGDADAARAAMRTHLANSRERRRRAAGLVVR